MIWELGGGRVFIDFIYSVCVLFCLLIMEGDKKWSRSFLFGNVRMCFDYFLFRGVDYITYFRREFL